MEIIRVLSPKHFDKNLSRFSSLAFRNSTGPRGGISVFEEECARKRSGDPCQHIDSHYWGISYQPPVFWKFSKDQLPANTSLELDDSHGDPCHYNVFGLKDKEAKRFFQTEGIGSYFICNGIQEELVNKSRIHELIQEGFFG